MRPASRRALLRRLAAAAPARSGWAWWAFAVAAVGIIVLAHFSGTMEAKQPPAPPAQSSPSFLVGALGSPFGEGDAGTGRAQEIEMGPIEKLRDAYRRAEDLQVLYTQWRDRPEADARYLAFRGVRDCELLRAGGIVADLDAFGDRKERERQMVRATARCRGFLARPVAPDELQRLEQDAAAAGSAAAQVALTADTFAQRQLPETIATLRKALASGDPLAYDEARVLLALSRHQVEIAGVAPTATGDMRNIDARVVAIDIVGCRLGNPCGPGRGLIAVDCGTDARCQREAEDWLMELAGLGDDERRTADALADRMFAAFGRGAIDDIVRMPSGAR